HTTTGCGKQGFPSAQPYLSHTPGANPFCCMFLFLYKNFWAGISRCLPGCQNLWVYLDLSATMIGDSTTSELTWSV
ncbi:hypothetical protein BO96DRAFT_351309, partial [Aspergillus niger CBS 101883]